MLRFDAYFKAQVLSFCGGLGFGRSWRSNIFFDAFIIIGICM